MNLQEHKPRRAQDWKKEVRERHPHFGIFQKIGSPSDMQGVVASDDVAGLIDFIEELLQNQAKEIFADIDKIKMEGAMYDTLEDFQKEFFDQTLEASKKLIYEKIAPKYLKEDN